LQAPKKPVTATSMSQGQLMFNNAFYSTPDSKHLKEMDVMCCIFT